MFELQYLHNDITHLKSIDKHDYRLIHFLTQLQKQGYRNQRTTITTHSTILKLLLSIILLWLLTKLSLQNVVGVTFSCGYITSQSIFVL